MLLDCDEVLPKRLWIGVYLRPKDVEALSQRGITSVISLQSDEDLNSFGLSADALSRAFGNAGIGYRRVPTPDFNRVALARNLADAVAAVDSALQQAEACVYLHCTAGVNRAPTVAAAYLIRALGKSALEAYEHVTARRKCSPYLSILEEYAVSLEKPDDTS